MYNPAKSFINFGWVIVIIFISSYLLLLGCGFKGKPSEDKEWKGVEIIILLLGGVAILPLILDMQVKEAQVKHDFLEPRMEGEILVLKLDLESSMISCNSWKRSKDSPTNFEEKVKQEREICTWTKRKLQPIIESINTKEPNAVRINSLFKSYPQPLETDKWGLKAYNSDKKQIITHMEEWNNYVKKKKETLNYIKVNDLNRLITYVSPYVIIISLSLAFIKILFEKRQ